MGIFKPSDGLRYELEERFQQCPDEFPDGGVNYPEVFKNIESYLNRYVHPRVTEGAAVKDNSLLTDHGTEHVKIVIQRAKLLLDDRTDKLTGFELFFLLVAIHFHDVGNIFGRVEHEQKIKEVMTKLGDRLPLDVPSKATIANIAMSHGGRINDSKDTFNSLLPVEWIDGIQIRMRLLAAILRFADEIADDHNRASRFLLETGKIPKKNEVFHLYSKCLQQPAIQGSELKLTFCFETPRLAKEKFGKEKNSTKKGYSDVYLYDEILDRAIKCFSELNYCKRHAKNFINIDRVKITIDIYEDLRRIHQIGFSFIEKGYPDIPRKEIDEFLEEPLKIATGRDLKKLLESSKNV